MLRVAIVWLVLGLGAARAVADARPTFTVEIEPDDALADRASAKLTDAIRKLGSARTATYRHKGTKNGIFAAVANAECSLRPLRPVTAGSHRAVVDCAAKIGTAIGVDYMFVGELVGKRDWYVVTMHVVHVATKKRVRTVRELIPKKGNMDKWAKVVFGRALDDQSGSLEIRCSLRSGTVFIDGELAAEIYEHRANLNGLAIGTHSVEIRAPGYKPYQDEVAVDGATQLQILLEPVAP